MANIKSAAKRAVKSREVGRRNAAVKTGVRTAIRSFVEILDRDPAEAARLYPFVAAAIDQAAGRKVIHSNTAARKKSRLAKLLAKRLAGASPSR